MTEELNEVYLSRVLGKTVINDKGQEIGALADLVMVPGETFPQVSHVIVSDRKRLLAIPWSDIALFNRFVISVKRTTGEFPRYASPDGMIDPDWNHNGAINAIAGILSEKGNVLGMMPHPENHVEDIMGSTDGRGLFAGLAAHLAKAA